MHKHDIWIKYLNQVLRFSLTKLYWLYTDTMHYCSTAHTYIIYPFILSVKYDPPVAADSECCALSGNVFASQLGYGWRIGDFSSEIVI